MKKLHFRILGNSMKVASLITTISFFSTNLLGWNKVWENTGANNSGTCRSPVICRNLNNDGLVTASFWYHAAASGNDRYQTKFVEVDDNGANVYRTVACLEYGSTNAPAQRIELYKILPDPANSRYLCMGVMHNPANPAQASAFIVELSSTLVPGTIHLYPGAYQYWDFAIAPNSGDIVACGFNNGDRALAWTSRVGVIAVTDQSFAGQSTYELANFAGIGTLNRFENVKCIDVYYDGTDEHVVITGNQTVLVGSEYLPRVFIASFTLASSALTIDWTQRLTTSYISQMIPADIIVDYSDDMIMVVGSMAVGVVTREACYWAVDLTGAGLSCGDFEGSSSGATTVDDLRPYHITRLNSGSYKISGWVNNYENMFGVQTNKYNWFEIDIDPSNFTMSNLQFYLGNTNGYSALWGGSWWGVDANTAYTFTSTPVQIRPYHTPAMSVTWYDGDNQQTAWSWVNTPDPTSPNRHQMRIRCTIAGNGDGGNCDPFDDTPEYTDDTPSQESVTPWSTVTTVQIAEVDDLVPNHIIPSDFNCNGNYN